MNGIKPLIQELHEDLKSKVTKDIQITVQEATDGLHINQQGRLTRDTEEKIQQHTEETWLNAETLRSDLRKEAETLVSELQDQYQQVPISQPTTPEQPSARSMTHWQAPTTWLATPLCNPYQQAPTVSPYHEITIPNEEQWNQMLSKYKEKVTLTYALYCTT